MRARTDVDFVLPLADAGVTNADVQEFWRNMPFHLGLGLTPDGNALLGNCDGCFLKTTSKLVQIFRHEPWRADWWIKQETDSGKLFRLDRPNYAALKIIAMQPQLFDAEESEDQQPCEWTD